ncbi:xanthine dehydrogenase family protein molybdopterin-binding subunit [Paracraurococcus lichenis]|uniref:Xanthine dehydrogenase family protein molybdopterin-binding subunit n=1 Tax=Paracraurococcus lichenis TaxID=3064888 RepID=A0ABT9DUD4_9PROT|nr:xanthine dehydrogenase family protein molybdopterin-binding subunit [Paracraurococcus sp. LOR1-02]MDO9707504.1 xanthine dehydrogenase family protein molybdopterin-binding subunit [Paracraurococcus sp. LOR1-02]
MDGMGIGAPVRRVEDRRFLRGAGRFVDDIPAPGALHLHVLRSPHAAARILSLDAAAACAMPGVRLVLTAADLDIPARLRCVTPRQRRDGSPLVQPEWRVLPRDMVRFVGDVVAAVVAETPAEAQDAAERIAVAYEPLPAVTDLAEAVRPDAPQVWPGLAPGNECFHFRLGDVAAVEAAFARAAHVVSLDYRISRVSANPLEPRNALALHDPIEDRYTLYTGTQLPHVMRNEIAEFALGVPSNRLRLVSPDVGGGFGMKESPFPEHVLCLLAARRLGRPVRWTATRTESFLGDSHARDNLSRAELALAADGSFLAMRVRTLANLGAYLAWQGPVSSTNNVGGLAGVYRTPHICTEVTGLFTHTQPTAPYRGAGRPEAIHAMERLVDLAAERLGMDRVALRRRNMIGPEEMPFRTGLDYTYDCGDFPRNLELALEAADWAGFPARRAQSAARGMLRGIGIANAIEIAGGPHRKPLEEGAEIRFDSGGSATLLVGSHNHGQGHETVFRQIVATKLGLAPDRVQIRFGDTDSVAHGRGTIGSRSMMACGAALVGAAEKVIARGRQIAAHLLEAAEADIEFEAGRFRIAGTDRGIDLEAVARQSYLPGALPDGAELGLGAALVTRPGDGTFPNGCHIAEVEIDPETGETRLLAYTVVDDVGTVINPLLLKGQIHGGVAQGFGQVFGEAILYRDGQILTASFQDYPMPRAADLCAMQVTSNPVPTRTNPLGVKGAGEAGTVGALPALVGAVVDALRPFGVTHLDMPLTPERVWQAIRAARPGG